MIGSERLRPGVLALVYLIGMALVGENVALAANQPTDDALGGAAFALHALGGEDGSHLSVELEPGASAELVVAIGNRDSKPFSLRTYAADAYTIVNGGFGVRDEAEPVSGPATWLDYSTETYELAPGETIERTFSVTVPSETPPGAYLAGIAAQTADPIQMQGSAMFDQVIRKAIGVTVTVPGPLVGDAELGAPTIEGDTSGASVVVPITNTGNISVRPKGALTLTGSDGAVVLTAPIEMRPVYGGHETTIDVVIPAHVPAGDYSVGLDLRDDDRGWSGSVSDVPVSLADPVEPETPDPIEITQASVQTMPEGEPPVYADVRVEITNRDASIPSSELTMEVMRDGSVVEEVVLGSSLALLDRTTTVERPYIPADGWKEGSWTFSLVLESVDPNTGVRAILATYDLTDPIVVE